jgi:hypothetical protein
MPIAMDVFFCVSMFVLGIANLFYGDSNMCSVCMTIAILELRIIGLTLTQRD